MRNFFLSTVFRNVPDQAGGGAPAPKPEDAPAASAAAPAEGAASVASEAPPAGEPGAVAPAGEGAAAADTAAPEPAKADAGEKPAAEATKDFGAETVLTGQEPKPGDAPAAAPTGEKPAEGEKAANDDSKGAKAAPGEKPADGQEAKAPDAPPAPKVAPVYEYEFPEGIKPDPEQLKSVNEVFAKHGVSPEAAKEFMNLHTSALKSFVEQHAAQTAAEQNRIWGETRQQWRQEGREDEQIGGAGYETSLAKAAEVRDRLVPKDRLPAFNRMLLVTGAGDHPEMLRFMAAAHRYIGEGVPTPAGINPAPNNGQPGGRRRIRDTYKQA